MLALSVAAVLVGRSAIPVPSPRAGPGWQEEADGRFKTVSWSLSLPPTLKTVRGFPGGSGVKKPPASARHAGLIPDLGRSLWRRKWQPIPVFLWEIPWTGGTWRVCGAAKSRTWLSDQTTKTVKTKWDKPKKATRAVPTSHVEILIPLCRETTNKTPQQSGATWNWRLVRWRSSASCGLCRRLLNPLDLTKYGWFVVYQSLPKKPRNLLMVWSVIKT